jgi:hypothetical protein
MRRVAVARAVLLAGGALLAGGTCAFAQNTVRYFTGVPNLLEELDTDVILKEVRQGARIISAELDVCHLPAPNSPLRERFVVQLKPQGNRLLGSGQSQDSKTPVSVDLARSVANDEVKFEGTIKYGDRTFKALSEENTDISEKDFKEQTAPEESIVENPADFREVTPGTIAFRVNRTALADFLRALRAETVKVQSYSIAPSCDALRRGYLDVQADIDPERAAALVAKAKSLPGVTRAGWTSGGIDLSRAIRFPAAGWRDAGGKLDREKLGNAVAAAAGKALDGKSATAEWDEVTGELAITVKRRDSTVPDLNLTEVIEIPLVISGEKPGATGTIVMRVGSLSSELEDEGDAPRLTMSTQSNGETPEPFGADGLLDALAREFKADSWDSEKENWAK